MLEFAAKNKSRYLNPRFRPSTESQTRNRLRGFSGTGSYRGFHNRLRRFRRRRGGYPTTWETNQH